MPANTNNTKYIVTLTDNERTDLAKLVHTGTASGQVRIHAQILLKADCAPGGPAWTDEAIKEALDVGTQTIHRVRQRFVEEGLDAALHRRTDADPPVGEHASWTERPRLTCWPWLALACSAPPTSREHWSLRLLRLLRLLADRLVVLGHVDYVDAVSHETVRSVLKKTRSSRG